MGFDNDGIKEIYQQKHYYKELYENCMEGILLTCPEGKILAANPAACRMFGYTEKEICALGWNGIADCNDPKLIKELKEREFNGSFKGELTFIHKDGSKFSANITSKVFHEKSGKSCTTIFVKDVSLINETEIKAYYQELIWHTMTEASPLAYFIVDNKTDEILYFNSRFCDIWGIKHLEKEMKRGTLKNNDIIPACLPLIADVSQFTESCKPLQDENNRSVVEDEINFTDGRIIRRVSTQIRDSKDSYFGRLYIFEDITNRKRNEQSVEEQREKYWDLFMNSPAIKMIVDPETGDIIEFNQAALEFYGYSEEKLKSMRIYDINIADPAIIFQKMQEVKKPSGKSFRFKHRLNSGEIRDVNVYSGLINHFGKKLISSIIFDITERQRLEEVLHETKIRLSLVIDGAKAGIWDWDMVNNKVYYDKQWKSILGYEENEILGGFEEWENRWHHDDAEKIQRVMKNYLDGKVEKYEIEHRLLHKNGTYRWILTTGKITFDQSNRPVRWVGSNIDITDRKQMEENQLESEKRLKEFAQAVPDASLIMDEDGHYIEVFGNYEERMGKSREELLESNIKDVLTEPEATVTLNEIKQCIFTNTMRSRIDEVKVGNDSFWAEARLVPMSYMVNGKRTVAIVLTDITQRRKVEKMLQFSYELAQKSDLINDIISGQIPVNSRIIEQTKKLGIDFSLPMACCIISLHKPFSQKESMANSLDIQMQKSNLIELLSTVDDCIIWECREHIGILLHEIPAENDPSILPKKIHQIEEKLRNGEPSLTILMGISNLHTGPDSLAAGYHEAIIAITSAKSEGQIGGSYYYKNLGLLQLLTRIKEENFAPKYVQTKIGPLLAYDAKK